MKFIYLLLLLGGGPTLLALNICTITQTDVGRDFCQICSEGPAPALVDGVFTGMLVLEDNVRYDLTASCLSSVVFADSVHFSLNFKSQLYFLQDPIVAFGAVVSADFNRKNQVEIHAYQTIYKPYLTGQELTDFANRMAASASVENNNSARLPISLTHWAAHTAPTGVMLRWSTAKETDNDFYLIEHSTDGHNFREFARVPGQASSVAELTYAYLHQAPTSGTHYYRLSQQDLDGTRTIFNILTADYQVVDDLRVFPNPAAAGQTVRFRDSGGSPAVTIYLYRTDGALISTYAPVSGGGHDIRLPADLPAGLYILRAGTKTRSLVILQG